LNRRSFLKLAAAAPAIPIAANAAGTFSPKIKDIQVIETAPAGLRLTVVKILTDQTGHRTLLEAVPDR
jgi:mannonate dehydratase